MALSAAFFSPIFVRMPRRVHKPDECVVLKLLCGSPDRFGNGKGKEGLDIALKFFRPPKHTRLDGLIGGVQVKDQEKDEQPFRCGNRRLADVCG